MAAGPRGASVATGGDGTAARIGALARALVAIRARDRGVRRRVDLASAYRTALMGLWEKLARVFGNDGEESRAATERVLLEAELGPAVVEVLLERLQQAKSAERQSVLERTVAELLANPDAPAPAPPPPPPRPPPRAPPPPTALLVFVVDGVGKSTRVAKLARRPHHESRPALLRRAHTRPA